MFYIHHIDFGAITDNELIVTFESEKEASDYLSRFCKRPDSSEWKIKRV